MEIMGVKIVVIGGGTGSFTLLRGLKNYTQHITALVSMADDGGSTGQLRDELGVLPPGDVRQCLVALSESPRTRDLFNYRFEDGVLAGHAFGNLFMAALEKMTGSFADAVEEASRVLNIVGHVEPVTLDEVTLVIETPDGAQMRGQYAIKTMNFAEQRPSVRLDPLPTLNPAAKEAIELADIVVIAPGDLYGSLAPALVVPGMSEALNTTKAKKVYVSNLVTKPGQTDGFEVQDFAAEIERFGDFTLDFVLYNEETPSPELIERYAKDKEQPVGIDKVALKAAHYEIKGGQFLSGDFVAYNSSESDPIASTRTLIRHDSDAVARAIMKLYFS